MTDKQNHTHHSQHAASQPRLDKKPDVPQEILTKWQKIVDLLARTIGVPAGLIMRVHPDEIEVFVSSETEDNPYVVGAKEHLNSGLYCEAVMEQREHLLIPNALEDPEWDHNPDLELNMIAYLGFPLTWPDRDVFGTVCVLDNKKNAFSSEYIELFQQFSEIINDDLKLLTETARRQRAEESLHEHDALFRLAFQSSPDAINLNRLSDGLYIDVNKGFCDIMGYHCEEVVGKTSLELDIWVDAADREKLAAGLRQDGFVNDLQAEFRRKDGAIVIGLMSARILPYAGDTIILSVTRDITERKQAEELAQEVERLKASFQKEQAQNELIQRIISMLSHDLRNPLAVIASSRDMLDRYYDRLSDEKRREKLDMIGRQVQFALDMLQDTVDMARGNLSEREFRPVQVNLAALCQISVQEIQVASRNDHVVRFINLGDVETVPIDEVLVSRILLNLLSNAIKYSPVGGEVRLELDRQNGHIVLRVRDQGMGIDEADLPRLFEPFYRAKAARQIEGTGLGLSIVKDCVERQRGRVHVESALGAGSTFTVELPIACAVANQ